MAYKHKDTAPEADRTSTGTQKALAPPADVPPARLKGERTPDRRYVIGAGNPQSLYHLTPRGREEVKRIVAAGAGNTGIARLLRISPDSVSPLLARDPLMQEAVNDGLAALDQDLTSGLLEQFHKGNAVAGMFLAKTKLGWREGEAPSHVPRATPQVAVNITLVNPAAPGDVAKIIGEIPPADTDDDTGPGGNFR